MAFQQETTSPEATNNLEENKKNWDKTAAMSLTNLPLDLFSKILMEIVAILGLRKAVKLRKVSRLFYHSITDELCRDYITNPYGTVDQALKTSLPDDAPSFKDRNSNDRLAGRLLLTQLDHNPHHDVLSPLKAAIETLPRDTEQTVDEITLLACEIAAERVQWSDERDASDMHFITFRKRSGLYNAQSSENGATDTVLYHSQRSRTELAIAIIAEKMEIVEELLHLDLTCYAAESIYFGTPLSLATKLGRLDMIKLLLLKGAKWLVNDDLWARATSPTITLIDLHLQGKISLAPEPTITALELKSHVIQMLLIEAAGRGTVNVFSHMWNHYLSEKHDKPEIYHRLLHKSISSGNLATLCWMLENGFEPDTNPHYFIMNETPIQVAAKLGEHEVMLKLLEHGADIDTVGELDKRRDRSSTALEQAVKGGYEDVVNNLLDHYGTLGIIKTFQDLDHHYDMEHPHIIRLLVARSFDLEQPPVVGKERSTGVEILAGAVARGNLCMVQMLVDAGVPLNHPKNLIWDPVMLAKIGGWAGILEFLMRAGAEDVDPNESPYAGEFASGKFPTKHEGVTEGDVFRKEGRY